MLSAGRESAAAARRGCAARSERMPTSCTDSRVESRTVSAAASARPSRISASACGYEPTKRCAPRPVLGSRPSRAQLPELDDALLRDLLVRLCAGKRSFAELRAAGLFEWLRAELGGGPPRQARGARPRGGVSHGACHVRGRSGAARRAEPGARRAPYAERSMRRQLARSTRGTARGWGADDSRRVSRRASASTSRLGRHFVGKTGSFGSSSGPHARTPGGSRRLLWRPVATR